MARRWLSTAGRFWLGAILVAVGSASPACAQILGADPGAAVLQDAGIGSGGTAGAETGAGGSGADAPSNDTGNRSSDDGFAESEAGCAAGTLGCACADASVCATGLGCGGGMCIALPDPIAHWKLDGDVADSSGNGFDGGTVGGATFVDGGERRRALKLNGFDAFARVPGVPDPESDSLSILFWFRRVDLTTTQEEMLIGKGGRGEPGFNVSLTGRIASPQTRDRLVIWLRGADGNEARAASDRAIVDAEWHHVALFIDRGASVVRGFLDARDVPWDEQSVLPGTTSLVDVASIESARSLTIGALERALEVGYHFGGEIDDVRLYDRILSQPEVEAIMDLPD